MVMFSTYGDLAPAIIVLTLILSLIIVQNITQENLKGIDSIFAISGFIFGLFMTFMNLFYTSEDLFLLSPVIAISCVLYLRYHTEFKIKSNDSLVQIKNRNLTIFNIIWWSLIGTALVTYHLSEIYTRHPLFFFLISGAVAILGVQIIGSKNLNKTKISIFIIKILLLSIILRYTAYFISPYPVGSDPWAHQEYIKYFVDFGQVTVPPEFTEYYIHYPIAHLYGACTVLIGSLSFHNAMFLIGMVLTFGTIIAYLIAHMLTGNTQIALISILLLNFTDVQIQWGVQVLAMSFAITIYAFIIFSTLKLYSKPESKNKYIPLIITFLSLIVWTHTISSFITLVSLFAMLIGYSLYEILYNGDILSIKSQKTQLLIVPFIFLTISIIYHWMDPAYPFFDMTFGGLIKSLSMETEFLGATTVSNIHGRWEELLQPIGFCLYVIFGIIGALYCLSYKELAKKYLPLFVLVLVLFFVRYAFPIFNMRNIIPDRWPTFAFISFTLFIGIGIYCSMSPIRKNTHIIYAVAIFFFIGSFFMVTNGLTNNDSPLYGGEISPKIIWTESEMVMFGWVNTTYDGKIIADEHTRLRPFSTYFKNLQALPYKLLPDGTIDTQFFSTGLVIWRDNSINRPVVFSGGRRYTTLLLDETILLQFDDHYLCISDVGTARSYLSM